MSIYGLHMAARTLTYLTRKSMILQNNLANQSTDGFKLDYSFGTLDPSGVPTLNRSTKLSQGSFVQTGNVFDVAIDGPGFFVVQGNAGPRLTRNGAFHVDPVSHQLVDSGGRPVLGQDGPITIDGDVVGISLDGTVTVDEAEVGRIRMATVAVPGQLEKEGAHLFVPNGPLVDADLTTTVRQFEIEESNVNGIDGIGDMIKIQRNFAMMTQAMRSMDEILETVTGSVGRL